MRNLSRDSDDWEGTGSEKFRVVTRTGGKVPATDPSGKALAVRNSSRDSDGWEGTDNEEPES